MLQDLSLITISYLIGNISAARLVSKIFNLPDPTKFGSKNPGTTNVLRTSGFKPALLTFLLDCLKGIFIAFMCVNWCSPLGQATGLTAVVLGHAYPVLYSFHGGKGVATALGVVLVLSWPIALTLLIIWLITVFTTRFVSLGSIMIAICAPIIALSYKITPEPLCAICIIALIILIRHKDNIKRLLCKQEKKLF